MAVLLGILSLFILACSPPGATSSRPKIFGGNPVLKSEYSQVVAIVSVMVGPEQGLTGVKESDMALNLLSEAKRQGHLLCTGILLSPQIVLTAGHCLVDERNPQSTDADNISDIKSGIKSLSAWHSLPQKRPNANLEQQIYVYRGLGREGGNVSLPEVSSDGDSQTADQVYRATAYKVFPLLWIHPLGHGDWGLLRLAEPVPSDLPDLPKEIPPAVGEDISANFPSGVQSWVYRLEDEIAAQRSARATLVGFGRREDDGLGRKFAVTGAVKPLTAPEAYFGGEGRDSCDGDSGGPAFVGDRLWAIASRGRSFECGKGGVVSLTSDVACWLRDEVIAAGSSEPDAQRLRSSINAEFQTVPTTGACRYRGSLSQKSQLIAADQEPGDLFSMCEGRGLDSQFETLRHMAIGLGQDIKDCAHFVEWLKNSKKLNLDGLMLYDVSPLIHLPQLEELTLVGNRLEYIGILGRLPNLKTLDITGNSVVDSDDFWRAARSRPVLPRLLGQKRQLHRIRQNIFLKLCLDPETPASAQKTVAVLMAKTMSQSCEQTFRRLLMTRSLTLRERDITDLSPLADMEQLTDLDLTGNIGLKDLHPLAGLESLQALTLTRTAVTDNDAIRHLVAAGLKVIY